MLAMFQVSFLSQNFCKEKLTLIGFQYCLRYIKEVIPEVFHIVMFILTLGFALLNDYSNFRQWNYLRPQPWVSRSVTVESCSTYANFVNLYFFRHMLTLLIFICSTFLTLTIFICLTYIALDNLYL